MWAELRVSQNVVTTGTGTETGVFDFHLASYLSILENLIPTQKCVGIRFSRILKILQEPLVKIMTTTCKNCLIRF